jgi:hypothetical protein
MVETDLYFGLNKPDGGKVTDQEWTDFTEKHISIVFRDGSTILDGSGSWRNPKTNQFITEPSRVVICLHKDDAQISARIDSLRDLYKKQFKQQSVLRVDKDAEVSF